MNGLELRQLWYLSRSGMVRLSLQLPDIIKQNNEKPEKCQKMRRIRRGKKWEAFRKKFSWVNELLEGGENGY